MGIVDDQLRDNTPPVVRQTFERLVADGHTVEDARRLIGCVVSTKVFDILTERRRFDEAAYAAMLRRLPILPWDKDSAGS